MLASFFYNKAAENAKDSRGPEEWDFRYEGPRPGSKETAVVMLADGVEAATRSIAKPTPARIESLVRKMVNDRLFDHQLDRSDLTLKELDIIIETFTKVLAGIFHTRIEYPEQKSK
jgi:membrane-associated HD superfamily phosphohydrolase